MLKLILEWFFSHRKVPFDCSLITFTWKKFFASGSHQLALKLANLPAKMVAENIKLNSSVNYIVFYLLINQLWKSMHDTWIWVEQLKEDNIV